jgi:hypothetical protein
MGTFQNILSQLGEELDKAFAKVSTPSVPSGQVPPVTGSGNPDYALPNSFIPLDSVVISASQVAFITNKQSGKSYKIFRVTFDDGKSRTYRIDENGILSCGKNIYFHPEVTIIVKDLTAEQLSKSVIDDITDFGGLQGDSRAYKFK